MKLDAQKYIAARLIYPPTDTDGDIQTSSEPPPPTPRRVPRPPTSRVAGDSAAGEPRTPQSAAAPRAFIGPSPHGVEGHAVEGHAEVAACCMKEREEFAARCLQRMEVQRRSMAAKAEAKAAARAEKVAARVEEVPPMPPKLRAKPQERSVGKRYRSRSCFDDDLAAWFDERDARNELMAKRRRAKERVRDAGRDRPERRLNI